MNIQVIYFSKSGNTKKIAEAIAEELSCPISSINDPIEDTIDVLFLGAYAHNFGLHKDMISFIENLDVSKIKKIALFSTSWLVENVNAQMAELLKNKDVEVFSKDFYSKGKFLVFNSSHPNEDDIIDAQKFARDIMHIVR